MPKNLLVLLILVASLARAAPLAAASDSWLMSGHDAAGTFFNPGERVITSASASRLHAVWTAHDVLYAIATGKRVYTIRLVNPAHPDVAIFDARSGRVVRVMPGSALHLSGRDYDQPAVLAYAHGKLLVGSALSVAAFDAASGRFLWRAPVGATTLVVTGGVIYTGKGCQGACGPVQSAGISLATGRVLWRHPGNFGNQPALVAGLLYQTWGLYTGETRVYQPQTGRLVASLPFHAEWTGDGHNAYADVSTGLGKDYWLERIGPTGKPSWKLRLGKVQGDSHAALAYGTLYAASNRFHPGLLAVNAKTGQIRWAADLGPSLMVAAADRLVFALHQTTGRVDILDASGGKTVRSLSLPGSVKGNIAYNLMISSGALYAINGSTLVAERP